MDWKKNYFTILQSLFIISGAGIIIHFKKGELELLINQNLTAQYLNVFFKYITHLGDGLILLPTFIAMLFIRFRYAAILALSALYQLILVHINKEILFNGMVRPKMFFEGYDLHYVDGVKIHSYNSFPSGHTATAFALFFLLALLINKKSWSVILFTTSLMVGFSRVYLMQHFFIDIYAGSIIGCISLMLAFYTINKFEENKLLDRKLIE